MKLDNRAELAKAQFLHRDGLGSVRAITNPVGARIESSTYKPYGEQVEPAPVAQPAPETKGWIGERYDADAGLQYLNARYYDPELGMFIQPDWWEVTKRGVGTNRYGYSFGDPVKKMDPGGNYTNALGEPHDGEDLDPETNPPANTGRTWAQDMSDVCTGGDCVVVAAAVTAGAGIVAEGSQGLISVAAEMALVNEDLFAAADGTPTRLGRAGKKG